MAEKKRRAGRWSGAIFVPSRLTDMLSRTRFSITRALNRKAEAAFKTAAKTCLDCTEQDKCQQWIASHPEGEGNAVPSFCPNANFIRRNSPRR
jgi:hypothetical protein